MTASSPKCRCPEGQSVDAGALLLSSMSATRPALQAPQSDAQDRPLRRGSACDADRRHPGGGHRQHADGRSRARCRRPRRNAASDTSSARCTSADCRSTSVSGHFLIEDFVDRRPAGRRPSVLRRRSGCRSPSTGRRVVAQPATFTDHARSSSPTGRCWSRSGGRATTFRSSRAIDPEPPERTEAVHDARVKMNPAGVARRVRLRGSLSRRGAMVAPNIDLNMTDFPNYHGEAAFHGGTVVIQNYLPMWANMKARFRLDGSGAPASSIDIDTDGAQNSRGRAWSISSAGPEQTYRRASRASTSRGCARSSSQGEWALAGRGRLHGHIPSLQGRARSGAARSGASRLGVYDYRFPSLYGSLHWTPQAVRGHRRRREALRGRRALRRISIKPLGHENWRDRTIRRVVFGRRPRRSSRTSTSLRGLRFAGRGVGQQPARVAERPVPRDIAASGRVTVTAPPDVAADDAGLPPARGRETRRASGVRSRRCRWRRTCRSPAS